MQLPDFCSYCPERIKQVVGECEFALVSANQKTQDNRIVLTLRCQRKEQKDLTNITRHVVIDMKTKEVLIEEVDYDASTKHMRFGSTYTYDDLERKYKEINNNSTS